VYRAEMMCVRSGTGLESGSSGSAGAVSAGARAGLEVVESSENRSHHQMEGYGLLRTAAAAAAGGTLPTRDDIM
jgi:hypothetical protein